MTIDKKDAKPSKDVIYLDLDDEITSIIDKVENAKEKVAALVLPKRPTVLQSIVNMRLLERAAKSANKNVVLITADSTILSLAGAAGLHIAKNLHSKPYIPPSPIPVHEGPHPKLDDEKLEEKLDLPQEDEEIDERHAKIDYSRSIGELAAAGEVDEPETIALNDQEVPTEGADGTSKSEPPHPKDRKLAIPNFDKFRTRLGLAVAGIVLLIIFIFLATVVLPKATITLKTTSLPLKANFSLTADSGAKSLDEVKNIIPATSQSKDQTLSQTVTATGQQNNGNKATGSVNMSAGVCSSSVPSDVPAGNGLSSSGLTYITQQKTSFIPVVLGGKCTFQSSSATPITAQVGGSKYNVSSVSFSVAGRPDVSASGSASGGTDNIATVLSQSDVDSAKQKLTSTDTDKFTKDFEVALSGQGMYLIIGTLKLSDPAITTSSPVGQPATTANVTVKITYSILTVKNDDLKKVVVDQLGKQIDTKKQKLSGDDPLKGLVVTVQSQDSPGKATLQLNVDTTAIPILDEPAIKKMAGGQKTGDIQSALSNLPGVQDVQVKFSPFWVSKAPKNTGKIKIIQEQLSSGNISP